MILLDANLLLYAYVPESEHHGPARAWVEKIFSGIEPVRIAWVTLLAFLRLSTDSRLFRYPYSVAEGVSLVSDWLSHPAVGILHPEERHWAIFSKLLLASQARSDLVMDAHLAALAIEHGAILCTNDKDFTRFPGLRVEFPLESSRP